MAVFSIHSPKDGCADHVSLTTHVPLSELEPGFVSSSTLLTPTIKSTACNSACFMTCHATPPTPRPILDFISPIIVISV